MFRGVLGTRSLWFREGPHTNTHVHWLLMLQEDTDGGIAIALEGSIRAQAGVTVAFMELCPMGRAGTCDAGSCGKVPSYATVLAGTAPRGAG